MSVRPLASVIIVLTCASGCVSRPHDKYDWGNYDPALYTYYKSPAKAGELLVSLQESIKAADSHKQPAAPGLRAEYGYLLLQQGRSSEAIAAFQTEEKQWPESKVFMEHMINVTSSEHAASQAREQGQ